MNTMKSKFTVLVLASLLAGDAGLQAADPIPEKNQRR
jgi:hypothetical protein